MTIFAVLFWIHIDADAQALAPSQDPAQRAQREQLEREREKNNAHQDSTIDGAVQSGFDELTLPVSEIVETGQRFYIKKIEISGDLLIKQNLMAQAVAPFEGVELGAARINALLKRLTALYVQHGFITTRCYVPEQNLSEGVLKLVVTPGVIARLQENNQTKLSRDVFMAFPVRAGDVLRLQDLEQGLDQLNRLRSNNQAQLAILPGDGVGESVIAINRSPATQLLDKTRFSVGLDNEGSSSTGKIRTHLGVDLENIAGMGEMASFSYVGALDSNAVVGSVSFPVGYNTFTLSGTYSEYQQLISDLTFLFGDSRAWTLDWNRVVYRDISGKWSADIAFTHRQSRRFIDDAALTPQTLTTIRLMGSRLWRSPQGYINVDLGMTYGLPWLDATRDAEGLPSSAAHANFVKFDVTASSMWNFLTDWNWRTYFNAQTTSRGLYGTEQVFIGGSNSVRGFQEDSLVGDIGGYMRNELTYTGWPGFNWRKLKGEPFAFVDAGSVELLADNKWRHLAGAGLGIRWNAEGLTSELTAGIPFDNPFDKKQTVRITASIGAQF